MADDTTNNIPISNINGSSKILGVSVRAYVLLIVTLVASSCVLFKINVPVWYVAIVSSTISFYFGKISATDK